MIEIKGTYANAVVFADSLEASAAGQIKAFCDQPVAAGSKIRIMPDVHAGKGCTIGTTMTITESDSKYRRRGHRLRNAHGKVERKAH